MWRGLRSYLLLFSIVYFGTQGYLDYRMTNHYTDWLIWLLPLLPIIIRLIAFSIFPQYWPEALSEEERDAESGRMLSLTLCGFSVSALFVLIATNPTFVEKKVDIEVSTFYMLMSAVALFGAFSMEAYKHRRWQQQLCLGLEDAGRFSLLASIGALTWVSQFSARLRIIVVLVCALTWGFDFIHRLTLWIEFFSAKRRYENAGQ